MIVTDPAVTEFVFLPRRDAALPVAQALWDGLDAAFGAARPLRDGVPTAWPRELPAGWDDEIVAARDWPVGHGLAQAVVSARRDAIGVGVAVGRSGDHPVEEFRTLVDRLGPDLRAAPNLSVCLLGRRTQRPADAPIDDAIVAAAGLGGWSAGRGRRLLVLVTAPEDAARAEERAWGRPGAPVLRLPLIARCWQSAALLDDQAAVFADTEAGVRERIARVDSGVTAAILTPHGTTDTVGGLLVDGVEAVIDLSRAASRLRDVRRTLESLRINVTELAAHAGLPQRDAVVAQRWIHQADQTLEHAESARLRADELVRFGQMRLALAQHRLADRQQRSVRIQTALVAALLAGLGAIDTFGVTARPPATLRVPVLVALVAVLVAAPLLAASWPERRFRAVDRVSGGVAAGAVTVAALVLPAGTGWALAGGALACLVVTGLLSLRGRTAAGS